MRSLTVEGSPVLFPGVIFEGDVRVVNRSGVVVDINDISELPRMNLMVYAVDFGETGAIERRPEGLYLRDVTIFIASSIPSYRSRSGEPITQEQLALDMVRRESIDGYAHRLAYLEESFEQAIAMVRAMGLEEKNTEARVKAILRVRDLCVYDYNGRRICVGEFEYIWANVSHQVLCLHRDLFDPIYRSELLAVIIHLSGVHMGYQFGTNTRFADQVIDRYVDGEFDKAELDEASRTYWRTLRAKQLNPDEDEQPLEIYDEETRPQGRFFPSALGRAFRMIMRRDYGRDFSIGEALGVESYETIRQEMDDEGWVYEAYNVIYSPLDAGKGTSLGREDFVVRIWQRPIGAKGTDLPFFIDKDGRRI